MNKMREALEELLHNRSKDYLHPDDRRMIAEALADKPSAPWLTYFVEATYATPNGNTGQWSGRMASSTGDILADAEKIIRKYRRVAGKLDIKATALR